MRRLFAVGVALLLVTLAYPIPRPPMDLSAFRAELRKEWPDNRQLTILFLGHSVTAGYRRAPEIDAAHSYPRMVVDGLRERYPHAQIEGMVVAQAGATSEWGEHMVRSDGWRVSSGFLVVVDFGANDIGMSQRNRLEAWAGIEMRLGFIGRLWLTPGPTDAWDPADAGDPLNALSAEMTSWATKHGQPVVPILDRFRAPFRAGQGPSYLASDNHLSTLGHRVVTDAILDAIDPQDDSCPRATLCCCPRCLLRWPSPAAPTR